MNNFFLFYKKNSYRSVSLKPFIYLSTSVTSSTFLFFLILLLQIAMLFVTKSYQALIVIGASCAGVILADVLSFIFQKTYHLHFFLPLIKGLIIGLLTPSTYPPHEIFIIALSVILIIDQAFSGYADLWVSPIVIVIAAAWMFNTSGFPLYQVTADSLLSGTPSLQLIQNGTFPVLPFDSKITALLNGSIFKSFGVSIPDGYISLFLDTHSVIPAFRFNFIILLSSIFLIAVDVVHPAIPVCYLSVYSLLVYFAEPLFVRGMPGKGDLLLALLTSGTLFCTFFLLQWYGTSPVSLWGKIIYGCTGGIIAFLIVGCGTSPVGSVFTVIIMNICSLIIQLIENRLTGKKMYRLLEKDKFLITPEVKK